MTKIMPVEQCSAVRACFAQPQSYASKMPQGYTFMKPTNKRIAEFALQQLEQAWKKDQQTHEKNLPALEANAAVKDRIVSLMAEVGMPTTRRVRDGNKTSYGMPKMKTVDAGYLEDIKANCQTSDNFMMAEHSYNDLKAKYDQFMAEAEKEAEQATIAAARAAEAEKERRRDNIEMAKIILRHELPDESTWDEILAELKKKDQRLDLAVAMQQTRSDWSDGFWRVSDALGRFKIETDEDKDIANDVVSCMSDDDGRVFRDCTWNYGRLFETASDPQLSADIQKAMSMVSEY